MYIGLVLWSYDRIEDLSYRGGVLNRVQQRIVIDPIGGPMSSTSCKARGVCSLLCVVLISYGAQTLYSVSAARLPRGGGGVAFAVADRAHPATLAGRSAALPVTFEANQGQTDPEVKFVSRGDGHTVLISPRKTIITMH